MLWQHSKKMAKNKIFFIEKSLKVNGAGCWNRSIGKLDFVNCDIAFEALIKFEPDD